MTERAEHRSSTHTGIARAVRRVATSREPSWALVALVLAPACVPNIEDDLATVSAPRVLAVRARATSNGTTTGTAEVAPLASAVLDALVAAPDGTPVPAPEWELCTARKPLTELGPVNAACLTRTSDRAVESALGRGDAVPVTVPRDACSLFGPNPPPPTANGPAGRPVDPDVTGGYYQPVVAFLGDADTSLGMLRLDCGLPVGVAQDALVDYGKRHRPNENPAIERLELVGDVAAAVAVDGGTSSPTPVKRGQRVTFRVTWAACPRSPVCGDGQCSAGETHDANGCPEDCPPEGAKGCTGAETYAFYDARTHTVVDRREGITVSWYATSGEFDAQQTGVSETDPDTPSNENGWTSPATLGDVLLWAVLRDDRGGVGFETYRLRVE